MLRTRVLRTVQYQQQSWYAACQVHDWSVGWCRRSAASSLVFELDCNIGDARHEFRLKLFHPPPEVSWPRLWTAQRIKTPDRSARANLSVDRIKEGPSVSFLRIPLISADGGLVFQLRRRRFRVQLAFAATVNKALRQTVYRFGLNLWGPLEFYLALSLATSRQGD